MDRDVALSEVRPPVGSHAVVAKFDVVRPIRLLDIDAMESLYVQPSVFDPAYLQRLGRAEFLAHITTIMKVPVMPGDEAADYLVTQAIAEYLASDEAANIDGLLYSSIQTGLKITECGPVS